MKTIFDRNVNEAVHQEDADEVTHLLPAWVGGAEQGGLPHCFDTLDTCRALYEKQNITSVNCLPMRQKMSLGYILNCTEKGTVPKSLTSGVSEGKTALASEVRKSGEVQRGS